MPDTTLTNEQISVSLRADVIRQDWLAKLFELGNFLLECENLPLTEPPSSVEIHIHAYEDPNIGGLRMNEISYIQPRENGGMSGASYQRSENIAVMFCAEEFMATHGIRPVRPSGWSSCLNEHGEARLALLRSMGMHEQATLEYSRQIVEEAYISESPSPCASDEIPTA